MYWDPFEEINRMHNELDRMFNRTFGQPMLDYGNNKVAKHRAPVAHLQETESSYVASIELPGVQKSDIQLHIDDKHIQVSVEAKQEKKQEDSFHSMSRSYQRIIGFPKAVDVAKAKASYKNGLLRIEVPKRAIDGARKLEIE